MPDEPQTIVIPVERVTQRLYRARYNGLEFYSDDRFLAASGVARRWFFGTQIVSRIPESQINCLTVVPDGEAFIATLRPPAQQHDWWLRGT